MCGCGSKVIADDRSRMNCEWTRPGRSTAAANSTELRHRARPALTRNLPCTECRAGTPASETRQANDPAADV